MRKYTYETEGGQRHNGKLVIIAKRQDAARRKANKFLKNRDDKLTGYFQSEKLSHVANVVWYDPGEY